MDRLGTLTYPHTPERVTLARLDRQGKQYVFGPKHRPVKIGVVDEQHPALRKLQQRNLDRGGGGVPRETVLRLMEAVKAGNLDHARLLVGVLEDLGYRV